MNKEEFEIALRKKAESFNKLVATDDGDWIVKGFIDIFKNIYTISVDTKVVSKVFEILLIPAFNEFAKENNLTLENQEKQNFYPDLTFISNETGEKFAVDIKSSIKKNSNTTNKMTLGTYQGYFHNRDTKEGENISYAYNDYKAHIVFGILYSQSNEQPNEKEIFNIDEIENIKSVIKDFQFFVHPKYKIASASKGSGNTRNIGAVTNIKKLLDGDGIFSKLGEEVFDDYWMYYVDNQMAKEKGILSPYQNLKKYLEYKEKDIDILSKNKELIEKVSEEEDEEGLK